MLLTCSYDAMLFSYVALSIGALVQSGWSCLCFEWETSESGRHMHSQFEFLSTVNRPLQFWWLDLEHQILSVIIQWSILVTPLIVMMQVCTQVYKMHYVSPRSTTVHQNSSNLVQDWFHSEVFGSIFVTKKNKAIYSTRYANNMQDLDYSRMDQTSNIQYIMTSSF